MKIRQEILLKMKSVDSDKKDVPKKVSSYFGENTFSILTMQKHISKKTRNANEMAKLLEKAKEVHHEERAKLYFEELKPLMEHIRKHADALECVVSDESWNLPKYREMLFIK